MSVVAVELDRQAHRDLRRLDTVDRRRALGAISDTLTHDPLPANADNRALRGRRPWQRLRVGELRILWRDVEPGKTRRVARVLHRRDLERAAQQL